MLIRLLSGNRLVLAGVELLADRGDGRESLCLKGFLELPGHQLDPLEPVPVDALRRMIERAPEVIEDGKELAQQLLVRVLGPISQLLSRPTLVVLEVRSQPLVAREHGLRAVASGLQFGG